MIQINAEHTLSVHLINTPSSERNDIKVFTDILKICKEESNKPGFKNMFNEEERSLINDLSDRLLPTDKK